MLNIENESQYKYNKFKIAVIIVAIISLIITAFLLIYILLVIYNTFQTF